ncbi:MAG: hypothetical protein ACREL5_06520 [Gemmatimonadales bacterium]
MTDSVDPDDGLRAGGGGGRPGGVIVATDRAVPLDVAEIADDRVPEGMACLGTYLNSQLVARCVVPPGTAEFFQRHAIFGEPRRLLLAAREEAPGLHCELYAIVPVPDEPLGADEDDEPWAASLPSSHYEEVVAADRAEHRSDELAAVLLGQVVRFEKDRRHPGSLALEAIDVLSRIVSGRVVEVVDRVLEDLLGN